MRLAIKHLKKCKSDCIYGIFSDNFINGTELLFFYISMLSSMILTHGVTVSLQSSGVEKMLIFCHFQTNHLRLRNSQNFSTIL